MDLIFNERGIQHSDGIQFVDNSDFALSNLYYVHWGATYDCVYPYSVQRDSMSSSILFRILEGSINFGYRGKTITATKNQVIILSGQYPQHYWTPKGVQLDWFHLGGHSVPAYIEQIYQLNGAVFDEGLSLCVHPYIDEIMSMLKKGSNDEHLTSIALHRLLGQLARTPDVYKNYPSIKKACDYLQANYKNPIHVETLADMCLMSKYHFSRIFKSITGESPHQYLLSVRLKAAKEMLANTSTSVEAVSNACGFGSTSHFIQHFKRSTSMTPHVFRKAVH